MIPLAGNIGHGHAIALVSIMRNQISPLAILKAPIGDGVSLRFFSEAKWPHGRVEFGVGLLQFFHIKLKHLPVIGHQSIDLHLHISCLGIDCRRQMRGDHGLQRIKKLEVGLLQCSPAVIAAVTPVLFTFPRVPLERQAKPSVFAQHGRARCFGRRRLGAGILVDVMDVAITKVVPATG